MNTFLAMAIDVETRRPKITNVMGGLSGPAIRPIAVRMVWECYQLVKIPIIGMGGITDARDAIEFMLADLSPKVPATGEWSYEVKWDGIRAMIALDEGVVRIHSRNHNDITVAFPELTGADASIGAR